MLLTHLLTVLSTFAHFTLQPVVYMQMKIDCQRIEDNPQNLDFGDVKVRARRR